MSDGRAGTTADELLRESEELQRRMVEVARDVADFARRLGLASQELRDDVRARIGEGHGDAGDSRTG